MIVKDLNTKWNKLENSNFKGDPWIYLIIEPDYREDVKIAINHKGNRCVLLNNKLSSEILLDKLIKDNIMFYYSRVYKQYILELLDTQFSDLFNDLIYSLCNKIKTESNENEARDIFVSTIIKWINFFNKFSDKLLSEKNIRGVFGELVVLNDYISSDSKSSINEILSAWKGPFNTPTDFVFDNELVEVKTKKHDATSVKISSEYQLESIDGKGLSLKVVSIDLNEKKSNTLSSIFSFIKEKILLQNGELELFYSALSALGLNNDSIKLYDKYKYSVIEIETYDCLLQVDDIPFPRLTKNNLQGHISKIKYELNLYNLGKYRVQVKKM